MMTDKAASSSGIPLKRQACAEVGHKSSSSSEDDIPRKIQNTVGYENYWNKFRGKFNHNETVNDSTQETISETELQDEMHDESDNKMHQVKEEERYALNISAARYNIGDLVKISIFFYNYEDQKLLWKYVGPYRIAEVLANDRYRITDIPGFNKQHKPYTNVIAGTRIRPWIHVKSLKKEGQKRVLQ